MRLYFRKTRGKSRAADFDWGAFAKITATVVVGSVAAGALMYEGGVMEPEMFHDLLGIDTVEITATVPPRPTFWKP